MSATPGIVILFLGLFILYYGLTKTGVIATGPKK